MAINIIRGDFLEATEEFLCHQVNCQGVMGSNKATLSTNVAHQIRQKWPIVYTKYKEMCELNKNILGESQFIRLSNSENKYVVNMYAQEFYGNDGKQYTSYEAFEKIIKKISITAEYKNYTVAMPFNIGCARGGASWDKIYELLTKYFGAEDQPSLTLYQR